MTDREEQDREHRRPEGATDATIHAAGTLSEALETVEQARGHLYAFHQLIGRADRRLGDAVEQLAAAGHHDHAERLRTDLIGRNVLEGRWTFQIVEEFDDGYWTQFRAHERAVRDTLLDGRRHLHEAEMKEARRTRGRPGHEARPADGQ